MRISLIGVIAIVVLAISAIGFVASRNAKVSKLSAEQSYLAVIASVMLACIEEAPESAPEDLIDELCSKFNLLGHEVTISKCDVENEVKGLKVDVLHVRSSSQASPRETYAFAPVSRRSKLYVQVLTGPLGYEAVAGDVFRSTFEINRKICAICLSPRD